MEKRPTVLVERTVNNRPFIKPKTVKTLADVMGLLGVDYAEQDAIDLALTKLYETLRKQKQVA